MTESPALSPNCNSFIFKNIKTMMLETYYTLYYTYYLKEEYVCPDVCLSVRTKCWNWIWELNKVTIKFHSHQLFRSDKNRLSAKWGSIWKVLHFIARDSFNLGLTMVLIFGLFHCTKRKTIININMWIKMVDYSSRYLLLLKKKKKKRF